MIDIIKSWAGVVALVAIALMLVFGSSESSPISTPFGVSASCNGGDCTVFTALNTEDGYWSNDTQFIDGSGDFVTKIGFAAGLTATTTTGTAATLVVTDLTDNKYKYVTKAGAANTAFTYTLPASTTLTSFLPSAGDMSLAPLCFALAASSTSVHDLVFAAGTGIDIKHASTTAAAGGLLRVQEGNLGCFTFIRDVQTDGSSAGNIIAIWQNLVNSD